MVKGDTPEGAGLRRGVETGGEWRPNAELEQHVTLRDCVSEASQWDFAEYFNFIEHIFKNRLIL